MSLVVCLRQEIPLSIRRPGVIVAAGRIAKSAFAFFDDGENFNPAKLLLEEKAVDPRSCARLTKASSDVVDGGILMVTFTF